ncbi:ribosomal protein S18-alanine N-acetyltransferase [Zobellella taiwanensis]|jgi:ribosomal-protein-alanine N-acetyltransferase|uniref:[Ribosomal protein bS18]-alanine N-acetyltransferase n=1 Tax=Zobellella taiwanensis TaxID=347535 RepID=A0A2P7QIK7_9GAMM|nr:ribosomal protein S18-alanine N-acetyltransferase [Zobellella taiwanensis]PSJ37780.1 ribosomal-protein-alanine N-acetyltransferase [Zobellella taiwanensis]
MQAVFRPLSASDLDAMVRVERDAHIEPWSREQLAESLHGRYFSGALWQQQQLLGFFIADAVIDESTLMNICIAPAWQGQGLGRRLLEHWLEECRQRRLAMAWLEVRVSNQAALRLYRTSGFAKTGRRKDYYRAGEGREDAIVMQKPL